jgi:pimeloyl-ACP methyl ester carboxylesterase
VSFVAAFLDVLSIDTVMLVGHSAGGLIAARFTLQHPSRVSRLVLVDSAGLGRAANPLLIATAQLPDWMVSLSINALLLPGSGVARALATGIQLRRPWAVTPREWIDQIRMTGTRSLLRTSYDLVRIAVGPAGQRSRYSVTDRLGELQMPTLVVWGLTDEIFPFWQGMLAARKIPQGRFAIITSGGHISYLDNHVQFIDFVGPFLRDDLKEREAIGDADSPEGLKQ